MIARSAKFSSQIGFTLVEVVLALAIFALMGTILYGAFSLGHSAVEKTQGSFERNQEMRSLSDLLGSYIRSSYPYRNSPQDPTFFYEGEEDRLTFVSAFSLALGGRGMAKISLSWEEADDGKGSLRLAEELPVRLGDESAEGGQRNSVVLQEGVKELRIAYLDPQSPEEKWEERWDAKERKALPRAVRLAYRTSANKEVRWVFPIMMSVLAQ